MFFTLALSDVASAQAVAEGYKPLFSDEVLNNADPETRKRLEALNERNYQRWQQKQKTPPAAKERGRVPANPPQPTMYRYEDANGQIRFSDKPVPGARKIDVQVNQPDAASKADHEQRLEEQQRMLDYFAEGNQRKEKARAGAAEQRRQKAHLNTKCNELLNEINDYRRGGFVYYDLDDTGERVYLSADELDQRRLEMEAQYEERCGKLPQEDD